MSDQIQWVLDYKEALSLAKSQGKFIFFDFYNPQ